MATKIVTKNSSTASAVPTASDLVQGELAVNVADKRLFTEDNGGSIIELGTNPSTIDINAGSIDGTAIGASSASTGAFTTLTATGLDVTGTVTASAATPSFILSETDRTDENTQLLNASGDFRIRTRSDDGATNTDRFRIDHATGDISFYEDTGTTAKLFWDASAERLGIGTTSPSATLDIESTTGNQLRIAYNSSFYWDVEREAATGDLTFTDASNGETVRFTDDGKVGIGTTSPSSLYTGANNLVVGGGSSESGMTIYSSSTTDGNIYFADGTSGSAPYSGFLEYNHSSDFFRVGVNASERMRIDSSGRVGIGVTPFSAGGNGDNLMIGNPTSDVGAGLTIGATTTGDIQFGDATTGTGRYAGLLRYQHANDVMAFWTNSSERMRIDSSGNLLVGKTSGNVAVAGVVINNTGDAYFTRDGSYPLYLNRLTSDGDIISLRKDGSTVGSIGVDFGDRLYIGTGDTALFFNDASDAIQPFNTSGALRDNAIDLGSSGYRFDDIYATNGTIQTSDRNEKQDIAELSEAEQRVAVAAKGLLRKFRWKDSVAEKGDDARIHFGIIAQDLQAAFEAEGLDAGDYAMFISTTWTDEETNEEKTRMGVRYSELLAFIISAI